MLLYCILAVACRCIEGIVLTSSEIIKWNSSSRLTCLYILYHCVFIYITTLAETLPVYTPFFYTLPLFHHLTGVLFFFIFSFFFISNYFNCVTNLLKAIHPKQFIRLNSTNSISGKSPQANLNVWLFANKSNIDPIKGMLNPWMSKCP